MIITITGDLGSGKSTIAKRVSKELNFKYISTGLIHRKIASKYNVDSLTLNKMAFNNSEIDEKIDGYLMSLNNTKNILVDSRLAWHFINDTFKIYFKVNSTIGAERIFHDDKRHNEPIYQNKDNARIAIKERKSVEDQRFLQKYNIDCNDLDNFDLIINTSLNSIESISNLLISLIKQKINHSSVPKLWVNPKLLYPTENITLVGRDESKKVKENIRQNGYNNEELIKCVQKDEFYFIWDGHKRCSAAIFNKIDFIPISVIAENDEEIYSGEKASTFISSINTKSLCYNWEAVHNFRYLLYPF